MAKYTYFNLKGLGEAARMILKYGDMPFEERTVDRFTGEWTDLKKSCPMGQLPFLEMDGITIHQSRAICRYLAKKCDLNGDNDREAAQIDMATDVIYDYVMKLRTLREIEDEGARLRKYEQYKETEIPHFLKNLDNIVKTNGGYFAAGKLTWADFYFVGAADYLSHLTQFNILTDHHNLQQLVDKVMALPQLKKYLSFRPNSDF